MNRDKVRFTQLIKEFKLKELVNELGGDRIEKTESIAVKEDTYSLDAIAEKRDFVVFSCSPNSNGKIPDYSTRKKIENKISKLYFEHLLIYTDADNHHQIWQLALREPNKPITIRETPYFSTQYPELLFQKLSKLFISIDEEEKISLLDVKSNVVEQFNTNAEKVTKRFYDEFKEHHKAFLGFIKGIEDKINKEWYASLMLNRLMFIYFIQKKGFLDNNIHYLIDKLKETQVRKGKDKFFSFYRNFLLVLFQKGLGSPESERSKTITKELGRVPYLNGGLFDVHQLEKDYRKIEIEDKAFKRIFKFFDEYNWHLDTKITATGRDINPDVIGYIFEKYINNRAAMGAYYTKEDITEYITKNTIIPFLFDKVKKDCANAFKEESSLWKMLRDNPDRYIFDAVKHGIYEDNGKVIASARSGEPDARREAKQSQETIRVLPPDIEKGVDTTKPNLLERRKSWNTYAPPEYALSTEIWREVVERRNRYFDIKNKIENGEVKEINDFITYNLNIRQFAQDAVEQYEGSDFINAFHKSITKITVLDPTCGSGAFLFAALNILEPLYEGCLLRMRGFIEEDNAKGGKKFPQFRKVLDIIEQHPNEKYYIYKSIILNNLYGVDIMNEAVEIAKLRLFLKLVAEVDDFEHLEPLPDIDFNIRTGNTLIGFATKEELDKGLTWSLDLNADTKKVYDELGVVAKAFKRYKGIQLEDETDHTEFKQAKDDLNERLKNLNETLNDYLGNDYGRSRKNKKEFEDWLSSHQPFHWFAEFHEIIETGGFDVIIGNPPYVAYNNNIDYELKNYETLTSKNLYGFCVEKSYKLLKTNIGRISMIIPISVIGNSKMSTISHLIQETGRVWFANFSGDTHPGTLFSGVQQNTTIFISHRYKINLVFSTDFLRFTDTGNERESLFTNRICYQKIPSNNYKVAKIGSFLALNIYNKIKKQKPILLEYERYGKSKIWYHDVVHYWVKCLPKAPYFKRGNEQPTISTHYKRLNILNETKETFVSILSSSLFYFWYIIRSNGRDVAKDDVIYFPIDIKILDKKAVLNLKTISLELVLDLYKNKKRVRYEKKNGTVIYDQFWPEYSKQTMDRVDKILAQHYGFTEEELDFIINYDIKYRMGKELEDKK